MASQQSDSQVSHNGVESSSLSAPPPSGKDSRVPLIQGKSPTYKVEVLDLRPTQLSVGMYAVKQKAKKLAKMDGDELDKFLSENPMPVVLGPGGKSHLVDHHHLSLAVHKVGKKHCYAYTLKDWSHVSVDDFWKYMQEATLLWLYNDDGRELTLDELIAKLKECHDVTGLDNDDYRSLSVLVRKHDPPGYYKSDVAFAEFVWANWLRKLHVLKGMDKESDVVDYVPRAVGLAQAANDASLPGLYAHGPPPSPPQCNGCA